MALRSFLLIADWQAMRRQTRLSTKVIIIWMIAAATYLAHKVFDTPALVPFAVLLLSRLFVWPAFPRANRFVWTVFWCTQILFLSVPIPLLCTPVGIVSGLIWGSVTACSLFFLIISDAALLYCGFQIAREEKNALPSETL